MGAVSYKTETFITLYTNFLNDSCTKGMEVAMKVDLSYLQMNKFVKILTSKQRMIFTRPGVDMQEYVKIQF